MTEAISCYLYLKSYFSLKRQLGGYIYNFKLKQTNLVKIRAREVFIKFKIIYNEDCFNS